MVTFLRTFCVLKVGRRSKVKYIVLQVHYATVERFTGNSLAYFSNTCVYKTNKDRLRGFSTFFTIKAGSYNNGIMA